MKKSAENLIKETLLATGRAGMEQLLAAMEQQGFFKAPCSTKFHLNYEGGLAEHSWNVYQTILTLASVLDPEHKLAMAESLAISALLHDLGKAGMHGKPMYVPKYNKNGIRSESQPYETNPELTDIPHEIRSVIFAQKYIALTEDEEFAILQHNGLYGDLKYALKDKETPLMLMLHWADNWCAKVTEMVSENDFEKENTL